MDTKKIKQLIEEMGNSKLTAVDIEFPDGTKISMKKDKMQEKIIQSTSIVENDTIENQIKEDKNEKKYGLNGSPTQVERIFPPEVNNDRQMWTGNTNDLADKISSKLKELKFI